MSLRQYEQYSNPDNLPEDYKVIIVFPASSGLAPVTGSLNTDFALGGGNTFDSAKDVFADVPFIGAFLAQKNKLDPFARIGGRSATLEVETRKIWSNSQIPNIPIELTLYEANANATDTILEKVKRLKAGVYPTRSGLSFKAPLGYKFQGRNSTRAVGTMAVRIGKWFYATGLVMENISTTFSKEVNSIGQPISITVSLNFQPFKAITYDEYLDYFTI